MEHTGAWKTFIIQDNTKHVGPVKKVKAKKSKVKKPITKPTIPLNMNEESSGDTSDTENADDIEEFMETYTSPEKQTFTDKETKS